MQVLINKNIFPMNKQIINKPPDYIQYGHGLNSCYTNIWKGEYVHYRFYEQGHWKENNICNALKEINWVPKKGKMYKCWWYSTNPSDPSDTGEDILLYVEESIKFAFKVYLVSGIQLSLGAYSQALPPFLNSIV